MHADIVNVQLQKSHNITIEFLKWSQLQKLQGMLHEIYNLLRSQNICQTQHHITSADKNSKNLIDCSDVCYIFVLPKLVVNFNAACCKQSPATNSTTYFAAGMNGGSNYC